MKKNSRYIKQPSKDLLEALVCPMNNTEITSKIHGKVNNLNRNKVNQILKTLQKYGLVIKYDGKYKKVQKEVDKFFSEQSN